MWTERCGDATELARKCTVAADADGRPDVIIAIGGDGTVREVATGLVDAGGDGAPPLVVLPGGTGNSNYRSLWDDAPWQDAVTAALTGVGAERRMLDLARITAPERLVVLGTSTGLFAEATARAVSIPVAGRSRYLSAIASVTPTYVPYPGQVIVDDAVVHEGRTVLVNVGGSRHRAGVFNVLPSSLRDDGLLDVCVIGAEVAIGDALVLMRAGTHLRHAGVTYARGRRVTVRRVDGGALPFETDGEVVPGDMTSFTIEVLPRVLAVLASGRRPGG